MIERRAVSASAADTATQNRNRAFSYWNALLVAAFVTGMALRAWQIDIQILIDDEWHAIHKLLRAGPLDILTHLGYADYSIPLTLYYQWLYRTVGLSEWGMHAPPLIASIGLLLIGPRLLARWVSLPTRAVWCALLAISPLLVYHAKIARPYALTSLLTFLAIVAFHAWMHDGRRRDAIVYVVACVAAAWLHAITLPFTLVPFLYFGVRALRPTNPRALARLVLLGVVTVVLVAAAILPALVNDWEEFSEKAGRDFVTLESVYRTLLMLAGTGIPVVGIALWAAVVVGALALARRRDDVASYTLTVIAIPSTVIALSGAEWISHPLVLARYLIPALPLVMLLAAEGMVEAVRHIQRAQWRVAAMAVLVAGLFVAGPIRAEWHYPNQFWGHLSYQFDYDPAQNPYVQLVPKDPIPAFYDELAKRPRGSVVLIETPWRLESHFNPQALYQSVHHQLIRIGLVTPVCGTYYFGEYPEQPGLRMREFVHLSELIRGETRGATYLVVHTRRPPNLVEDPGPQWPDMNACLPTLETRFGPSIYRDDQIVVYPLRPLSSLGNTRRTVQQ
jgi:hypothetical protein